MTDALIPFVEPAKGPTPEEQKVIDEQKRLELEKLAEENIEKLREADKLKHPELTEAEILEQNLKINLITNATIPPGLTNEQIHAELIRRETAVRDILNPPVLIPKPKELTLEERVTNLEKEIKTCVHGHV